MILQNYFPLDELKTAWKLNLVGFSSQHETSRLVDFYKCININDLLQVLDATIQRQMSIRD